MNPEKFLSRGSGETRQKFLQFQLGTGINGLLEAKIAKEIITIPAKEILPVPEMPNWVIGIFAYRSEMLWIIDLKQLLGYQQISSLLTLDSQVNDLSLMAIVASFENQSLGLVVPNVQGIVEHDLQEIQSPSSELFSQEMIQFIEGHFPCKEQEITMLLNPRTIFYNETNNGIKSQFNSSENSETQSFLL
ncbi:MAG TPA: chemotaxis protein CheW [Cyanothece sp. UBA12306]|nr:chemotaxis protein CheW [Cyanothece sp. UBA12306]